MTNRILRKYRLLRRSSLMTLLLGPRYVTALDKLEIDITYECNLACDHCNRSSAQVPSKDALTLTEIESQIQQWRKSGKKWKKICVMGGEPTLHPQFLAIVAALLGYRSETKQAFRLVIKSNGTGDNVRAVLRNVPAGVEIVSSYPVWKKIGRFSPFNLAPIDEPGSARLDFKNGCEITQRDGLGLTPLGYYHCAVAGGIDRFAKLELGKSSVPSDSQSFNEVKQQLCRYCGHFNDGLGVEKSASKTPPISKSWTRMYAAAEGPVSR